MLQKVKRDLYLALAIDANDKDITPHALWAIRTPWPLAIPIVVDTVTGMGASPKVLSILPGLSQTTTTSCKMKYRVKEK